MDKQGEQPTCAAKYFIKENYFFSSQSVQKAIQTSPQLRSFHSTLGKKRLVTYTIPIHVHQIAKDKVPGKTLFLVEYTILIYHLYLYMLIKV